MSALQNYLLTHYQLHIMQTPAFTSLYRAHLLVKMRNVEEAMNNRVRAWDQLPQELMEMILRNLGYLDHLQFRAVCKGWRSMYRVRSRTAVPMFMSWHKDRLTPSKIFDPVYKKTFSVHPNCDILIKDDTLEICASKFGWLLFCKQYKTHYARDIASITVFFFVNPFTGESVNLPPLSNYDYGFATFTNPPTSTNCLVLNYNHIPKSCSVSTITVGDKDWESSKYSRVDFHLTKNVVFLDNIFYFVSPTGKLATFNAVERTWQILNVSLKWDLPCTHLLTWGEELLVVCVGSNNVFKFSFAKRSWKHMESLKGGTLFLGVNSFAALPSHATRKMGDRFYFADVPPVLTGDRFEFYSMRSSRFFSGVASYGDVTSQCPKTPHLCKKLWIEPPLLS